MTHQCTNTYWQSLQSTQVSVHCENVLQFLLVEDGAQLLLVNTVTSHNEKNCVHVNK